MMVNFIQLVAHANYPKGLASLDGQFTPIIDQQTIANATADYIDRGVGTFDDLVRTIWGLNCVDFMNALVRREALRIGRERFKDLAGELLDGEGGAEGGSDGFFDRQIMISGIVTSAVAKAAEALDDSAREEFLAPLRQAWRDAAAQTGMEDPRSADRMFDHFLRQQLSDHTDEPDRGDDSR